ncbi:hypothetical protein ACE4RV_13000 [Acetobacter persici]|uniref:hypothetical protein n=1 Tax=Acetobacter persici TaxID=1076596 RepID=UPI0036DB0D48
MSEWIMMTFVLLLDPGLERGLGALGEGAEYRQDKSREVRHGWGWFCGGFLRIFGTLCEVRGALKPAGSRFWRFTAVSRTSRALA